MTITYPNGAMVQAVLLARGSDYIRAAVPGDDDVRTLHLVCGNWFSDSGDAVNIEFAAQRCDSAGIPSESECVCPKELAARLLSLLAVGSERDDSAEDMLYVLSPDGADVHIQGTRLYSKRPHAIVLRVGPYDSSLSN